MKQFEPNDHTTTLQQLKDAVQQFRTERGWAEAGTPRNLASSIIIEAAELLEHFQWNDYQPEDRQEIIDELADIMNYCFIFAVALDIDLASACRDKLERAKLKFPTELFNPTTKNEARYKAIRKAYRENKKR